MLPRASVARGVLADGRRVTLVDLGADSSSDGSARAEEALQVLLAALASSDDLARAATRSGPALAIAAFAAARRDARPWPDGPREPAFVVSVGSAVGRGVPTAARATITAPAPLRRGVVEAQFGGPFGAALAQHTDALVVVGRAPAPCVIGLDPEGGVRVNPAPPGVATTSERASALAQGGTAHVLTTGPAADAGLPFASLASFDGADLEAAPSLVGRGGLGATVRGTGVVALHVAAPEEQPAELQAETASSGARPGLLDALLRSPRLVARSAGGTLELAPLRDERVDLRSERRRRTGCRGCPTPCGWTFDVNARSGGAPIAGRFAALQGFARHGDVLALLARCNDLGLDARSAAVVVQGMGEDADAMEVLDRLVEPGTSEHRAALAQEPVAGVEPEPGATFARADLAARVGQALAARGPEPVRSLSVFGLSGRDPAPLVDPLPWTGDRETDAGVLAHWHECFAAAVDVTGFCAFSAGALVADGVLELDDLARELLSRAGERTDPARALLATGADHVALHRELAGPPRGDAAERIERDLPKAAAAYRDAVARGFAGPSAGSGGGPAPARGGSDSADDAGAAVGTIRVRATGPLAARLARHPLRVPGSRSGGTVELEVAVPARGLAVSRVLRRLAEADPTARRWLVDDRGRGVPAVVVDDRRFDGDERIPPGRVADLVLAIPGG
ncbi:MAG: aldehyde ferredoxin oxidoreductase N-terminal domain-containing protein [Planctomycetota bacterium]